MARWLACGGLALVALLPGAGRAQQVEFGWIGTVVAVDPALAAALPAGSGIEVGARASGSYRFESGTPDASPVDPRAGEYPGAVVGWTATVGAYTFSHDPAGASEIDVLLDLDLTIYQVLDDVLAAPGLPGAPTLESDVFYLSVIPNHLPSDALPLTPLDPADWDIAAVGLFDASVQPRVQLIDIDLSATCLGPCPAVPVFPMRWGGHVVAILLLSAVGWRLSSARLRAASGVIPGEAG